MSKKKQDLHKIKLMNFLKNNMIFIGFLGILIVAGVLMITLNKPVSQQLDITCGSEELDINYFYLETCPHCKQQKIFNNQLIKQCPNINLISYEMTKASSLKTYKEFASNIDGLSPEQFPGTPLTIINGKFNVGYGTMQTTGKKLISMIEEEQGVSK